MRTNVAVSGGLITAKYIRAAIVRRGLINHSYSGSGLLDLDNVVP